MVLFRREVATPRARAALVVSHDFDGLLRLSSLQVCCTLQPVMGFVTLPARPVRGSSAQRCRWSASPRMGSRLSRDALPCEAFPSSPALRRVTTTDTFSPLPSARAASAPVLPPVRRPPLRVSPTSRSCSSAESVAVSRCGHLGAARCSLGLVPQDAVRDLLASRAPRRAWAADRLHVAGRGCSSEEARRAR